METSTRFLASETYWSSFPRSWSSHLCFVALIVLTLNREGWWDKLEKISVVDRGFQCVDTDKLNDVVARVSLLNKEQCEVVVMTEAIRII